MLEGLERLVELQRVDEELTALEAEERAIPSRRDRIAERRAACTERVEASEGSLHSAESEQRAAEAALQDQEALLKRLEAQQSQVKSNEAYTALLHEMEQAQRAISDCEDRILESLDAAERARVELAADRARSESEREALSEEERSLAAREEELAGQLAGLRAQRERVCETLSGPLLDTYRKLAGRRKPAVVLVDSEICGGCRVNIPPQTYIEIIAAERLVTCGNCRRILLPANKLSAR